MFSTIVDRQVEVKVMEKEKAKQKYDDALAQGKAAALLSESKDHSDLYELYIGHPPRTGGSNRNPSHPAPENLRQSFDFILPMAYFPKYSDHDEGRLDRKLRE